MKKKYLLIALSALCVGVAAIGGTMAAKSDKGVSITAEISEKTIGVKADKTVTNELSAMPGAQEDVHYNLLNDGGASNGTSTDKGSYDIYAKVDVYFDWTQNENSKSKYGKLDDINYIKLFMEDNVIPEVDSYEQQQKIGDWIVAYNKGNQLTMYYTKPLKEEQKTSDFISKIAFDTAMDNKYADAKLEISTDVSAVQADSADAAFATEWGVFPNFIESTDGFKVLDSISENAQ